jgi:hypothetical protein
MKPDLWIRIIHHKTPKSVKPDQNPIAFNKPDLDYRNWEQNVFLNVNVDQTRSGFLVYPKNTRKIRYQIWWNKSNLKTVSDVFCGWRLKTLIRLSGSIGSTVIQQCRRILFSNLFQFLVCFVALQVTAKGSWWVGFSNGAQSRLLNENFSCTVWIMVLRGDWQEDFWGAKGQGWEEYIWCWLKRTWQKLFVMKGS